MASLCSAFSSMRIAPRVRLLLYAGVLFLVSGASSRARTAPMCAMSLIPFWCYLTTHFASELFAADDSTVQLDTGLPSRCFLVVSATARGELLCWVHGGCTCNPAITHRPSHATVRVVILLVGEDGVYCTRHGCQVHK